MITEAQYKAACVLVAGYSAQEAGNATAPFVSRERCGDVVVFAVRGAVSLFDAAFGAVMLGSQDEADRAVRAALVHT